MIIGGNRQHENRPLQVILHIQEMWPKMNGDTEIHACLADSLHASLFEGALLLQPQFEDKFSDPPWSSS
jgi:hypothetical protein